MIATARHKTHHSANIAILESNVKPHSGGHADWNPFTDIHEYDDGFTVHFEIPGIDPSDVTVEATKKRLTVRGNTKLAESGPFASSNRLGYGFSAYERSISFPTNIDTGRVKTKHHNGFLTIVLPKETKSSPQAIKVVFEN